MKERNINGDLIRCVAVISVVCVHFFLNTGFYAQSVVGGKMFLMCILRTAFMVCVPLFLLLSGYFMGQKTLSKEYYKGIAKVIGIYFFSGVACVIYKVAFVGSKISFADFVFQTLSFKAANYGWYVNMYIGLFLIIPFLNLAYNSLKSKKQKQVLVLTCLLLTCLPTVFNIFNFQIPGWWQNPSSSSATTALVPDWWSGFYPITYYYIGVYLKEFGLKISKTANLILYLVCVVGFGAFNYLMSDSSKFAWGKYNNWGGFENVILSVLVFVFITRLNLEKLPKPLKRCVGIIAKYSLATYLVSYIFDNLFYTELNKKVEKVTDKIAYFPLIVPLVFVCSLLLGIVVTLGYKYFDTLCRIIFKKLFPPKQKAVEVNLFDQPNTENETTENEKIIK